MIKLEPKVRELARKAPGLCGMTEPLSIEQGDLIALAFDTDASKQTTAFDQKEGQSQFDRIECAFSWKYRPEVDIDKAVYIQALISHCADARDKFRGKIVEHFNEVNDHLVALERNYSDVAMILTVEEASTMTYWAPEPAQ